MTQITTNADEVADAIARKASQLSGAVAKGMRSALLAVESAAVKNLSGDLGAEPYAYPVPARTGNLRRDRTVQQPSPGLGIISFLANYAYAVETGQVNEWAGRGRTRKVQRQARPFAEDAVKSVQPEHFVIDAVQEVIAA